MDAVIRSALLIAAEGGAATSIGRRARRLGMASLGIVAIASLIAAAIGCAAAALWIFAIPGLGPVGAPLLVAGVLLVMGMAVLALTLQNLRRGRVPPLSSATSDLVLAEAMRLVKDHKGAVLMAALVAGMVAGSDKG